VPLEREEKEKNAFYSPTSDIRTASTLVKPKLL